MTAPVTSTAPKVTVLPKVTREMVLEEEPDLAWTRSENDHLSAEFARLTSDRQYEGVGTG